MANYHITKKDCKAFRLFQLELKAAYGNDGEDAAHELWQSIPESVRDDYKQVAKDVKMQVATAAKYSRIPVSFRSPLDDEMWACIQEKIREMDNSSAFKRRIANYVSEMTGLHRAAEAEAEKIGYKLHEDCGGACYIDKPTPCIDEYLEYKDNDQYLIDCLFPL